MFVSFMRPQFDSIPKTIVLVCSLTTLLLASRADAQFTTNNYIYGAYQAGSPGTNWSGPGVTGGGGVYWKLNNTGTAVQPTNGTATSTPTNYNIYSRTNNGLALGGGNQPTTIRDPYTSPLPSIAT